MSVRHTRVIMDIGILIFWFLVTVNCVAGQLTKDWVTENIIQEDKIPPLEDDHDAMFTLRVRLEDPKVGIRCQNGTDPRLMDGNDQNAINCTTGIELINGGRSRDHWSVIRVWEVGSDKQAGSVIYGGLLARNGAFTATLLNRAQTRPLGQNMRLRIKFHRSNIAESPWRIQWKGIPFMDSDPPIIIQSLWTGGDSFEFQRDLPTNDDRVANYTLSVIDDTNQRVFSIDFEFFKTSQVDVASPEQYFPYNGSESVEKVSSEYLDRILGSTAGAVNPWTYFFPVNKSFIFSCFFNGYPFSWKNAGVYWKAGDCSGDGCVRKIETPGMDDPNGIRIFQIQEGLSRHRLRLLLVANETGAYFCGYDRNGRLARYSSSPREFVVADSPNGSPVFVKQLEPSTFPIIDGQRIVLQATVNRFRYEWPIWKIRNKSIEIGHPYDQDGLKTNLTQHGNSLIFQLIIENASLSDSDQYRCKAQRRKRADGRRREEIYESNAVDISVLKGIKPYFGEETYPKGDLSRARDSATQFYCDARGIPEPTVIWIKNGRPIDCTNEDCKKKMTIDGKRLTIQHMESGDAGRFMCLLKNSLGVNEHEFTLSFDDSAFRQAVALYVCMGIAAILAVISIVFALRYWRKNAKSIARMRALEDELREEPTSDVDVVLDENTPTNYQADRLRFYVGLDVTDERIKIEELAGSGFFANVYRGYMRGDSGERDIVAIKRLKGSLDYEDLKQFVREIKLMQFLPHHVNVLSLLGVMSKNMSNGKLCAVLEFCDLGCLLDYVRQRAGSSASSSLEQSKSESSRRSEGYIRVQESSIPMVVNSIYGKTVVKMPERVPLEELLKFSYQIACGMEYLISRNIVHRDIALRNILLKSVRYGDLDFVIVKVADFGLARREDWTVDTNPTLPWRWSALEALEFEEFGWESDVWSFGVVLWELFSMGRLPYSNFENAPSLIPYLKLDGRLQRPEDCPEPIFNLMKKCWSADKSIRPTFGECRDAITEYATSIMGLEWQQFLDYLRLISEQSRVEIMNIKQKIRSWNLDQMP